MTTHLLIPKLEALLNAHSLPFARQTDGGMSIYDVCLPKTGGGLIHRRAVFYLRPGTLYLEAPVPVSAGDEAALASLVNQLNLRHPEGVYQYDEETGVLCWCSYLPTCEGEWPGDESVLALLDKSTRMAGLLYEALTGLANKEVSV